MGIQRYLDRFRRTARGGRSDLEQFIVEGENTPPGEDVWIPEGTDKRIDLPGFEYADGKGVIVRGDELEEGDVVEAPDRSEDGEPRGARAWGSREDLESGRVRAEARRGAGARSVNLRMVAYKDGSQEKVRLRYDGEMTEHEISEVSEPEIGYGGVRQ